MQDASMTMLMAPLTAAAMIRHLSVQLPMAPLVLHVKVSDVAMYVRPSVYRHTTKGNANLDSVELPLVAANAVPNSAQPNHHYSVFMLH